MSQVRVSVTERTKIRSVVGTMAIDGSTITDGTVTTAELGGDITTAGKALLDDANAAAQRTTLGLGTAATSASSAFAAASHNHAASEITSGTIATLRLGSGTASANTFLRGDQTFQKTWNIVEKAADQSKSNDTSLALDTTLKFSMVANTIYRIRMTVFYQSDGTADFKYGLTGPSSPTKMVVRYTHVIPGNAANTNFVVTTSLPSSVVVNGTTADPGYIVVDMFYSNGSNADTFGFMWAQNTSNSYSTTVLAGSTLEYMVVADLGA